ncbi:MAG: hypothetical protein K2X81_01960, partial [Candidatus Obscuribacterales bacterium]|nr:hypothetical protein [Candidatus Obscuribacterales bacterium]
MAACFSFATAVNAAVLTPEAQRTYLQNQADPTVKGLLKSAQDFYLQGKYKEAELNYKTSLAVKPTAEAYVGLGRIAQNLHSADGGKREFDQALELDPNSAEAHHELGMYFLRKADLNNSSDELSKAISLNPSDKEAGQNLVKVWQCHVKNSPDANSHLGLARAYQLIGDLPSAQAEYKEVVRLDPNNPALVSARESFKAAEAKQVAENEVTAAEKLEAQGHLLEAYNTVADALRYSPGNSNYMLYGAELLEGMGRPAQARDVYLNVLQIDPKNVCAAMHLKKLAEAGSPASEPATNAAQVQAEGFPGTKFPLGLDGNPITLTGQESAASGSTQVGTLSSFITNLRDSMQGVTPRVAGAAAASSLTAGAASTLTGGGAQGLTAIGAPSGLAGGAATNHMVSPVDTIEVVNRMLAKPSQPLVQSPAQIGSSTSESDISAL